MCEKCPGTHLENRTYSIVPTKLGVGTVLDVYPGRNILECLAMCSENGDECVATNIHLVSHRESSCHLFSDTRAADYSPGAVLFAGMVHYDYFPTKHNL